MILVPFTHTSVLKNKKTVHTIRILMEGGQTLWTEEAPVDSVLELNELTTKGRFMANDMQFLHIDELATNMDTMYDWRELEATSDTLCWRTYHVLLDEANEPWIQIPDSIRRVLIPILKDDHVYR